MASYNTKRVYDPKAQALRDVTANKWGTLHANHAMISRLRKIVPFDQYALSGLDYPGLGLGAGVMLASDMPEDFLKQFLERGLFKYDPLSTATNADNNWASWHDLQVIDRTEPKIREIIALQNAYGISVRSGVVFFNGHFRYGGATFTRNTPFTEDEKFILEAAGRTIHHELSTTYIANMTAHSGLTTGEIACLQAIAKGQTSDEAARSTGFTVQTLAAYIKSACHKLGAINRTHAVAEAVRRKIID